MEKKYEIDEQSALKVLETYNRVFADWLKGYENLIRKIKSYSKNQDQSGITVLVSPDNKHHIICGQEFLDKYYH